MFTNKGIHLPCLPPVRRPEPAMRRENQETNEMHTTLMDVIPENILHLNRDGKLELQTELLALLVDKA